MKSFPILRKNLRSLRLGLGLTQLALAEKTGLDYKYYQDLEAGRLTGITLATIERLADALDAEVWKLFHPDIIPVAKIKNARSKKIDR